MGVHVHSCALLVLQAHASEGHLLHYMIPPLPLMPRQVKNASF